MGTVAVIVTVCIVNLILWFVFFKKFNRLFSTEDIVNSTRSEINKLTDNINRETARDLRLADDKLKMLEKAIADTEVRFAELNEEMMLRLKEYRESLGTPVTRTPRYFERVANPLMQYKKNSEIGEFTELKEETFSETKKEETQDTQSEQILRSMQNIQNEENGLPNVTFAENPVIEQKSFEERVCELYEKGYDIEQIALELNSSTTEVQLIIDMNF